MVAALVSGCVVPSPGLIEWWVCIAYGPQATIIERHPDGTVIEKRDGESDPAIKETMRACRE